MKKYKKTDEVSYALGITIVFYLIEAKKEVINKIYIHSKFVGTDAYNKLISLCDKDNIKYEINDKVFNVLSDKENCFVIGEFKKYETNINFKDNHLVLVNPANAGNLGTIIRSMLGFNISNLVIITPSVDIFDPKVIRSSMGAIFNINFKFYDSFLIYQKEAQDHRIFPFMLQTNNNIKDIAFENNFSLVFGNEATGLDQSFLKIGTPVKIHHSDKIDSLNLPNAVTIGLYEATKKLF